jgi:hypothetical protein
MFYTTPKLYYLSANVVSAGLAVSRGTLGQ